jgi:hypothetical protein
MKYVKFASVKKKKKSITIYKEDRFIFWCRLLIIPKIPFI